MVVELLSNEADGEGSLGACVCVGGREGLSLPMLMNAHLYDFLWGSSPCGVLPLLNMEMCCTRPSCPLSSVLMSR